MNMIDLSSNLILSLADSQATIERVGGKGASLARLAAAGLPVPDGFHITTEAYNRFVDENNLQARIQAALEQVDLVHPATLEAASRAIREMFAQAQTPPDLASAIVDAYAGLPGWEDTGGLMPVPVAVRSSATAEDLPEASFAGQQETYLNVLGAGEVLAAVRRCWGSLWTARAISYRARQNIASSGLSLAVVVQTMVPAEAAGILFTANPVNGRRDQAMISAAWGLGEAIVGGLVTPDMHIVDKTSGAILEQKIADKQQMTVRSDLGTLEQDVPAELRRAPVLNAGTTAELVKLGVQIEALYGLPMDIEWALAAKRIFILQARPITALPEPEVPLTIEWKPPLPDGIYMRTSVVDLMPDPLSPLYATLGIPSMVEQMYPLGKRLIGGEPVFPDGYFTNINSYAYMNAHFTSRAWGWILFRMLPAYPRLLRMLVRFWREEAHPDYQKAVAEWKQKDMQQMTVAELWQAAQEVVNAAGYYTGTLMFATMGASAGSEALLTRVYEKTARRADDPPATALLMGWDNLPARAEKSLYDLAMFCREHEGLSAYVLRMESGQLVEELAGEGIPDGLAAAAWDGFRRRFGSHLDTFGHMVFELDFAKPLPSDCPAPMLEVVKMYLRGEGTNPHERQKSSEERRIQTAEVARARLKGLRRWAFTKALNWAQSLSEVREDALAEIGLGYPLIRGFLHELGGRFARAGAIKKAEDIFWLEKDEVAGTVAALEMGSTPDDLRERVVQRQAFWEKVKAITMRIEKDFTCVASPMIVQRESAQYAWMRRRKENFRF
jgi:pyruvate,water dikinase